MNSLNTVHRRSLITASLTFAGILLIIFLYWRGVSKGSLPSPTQPLVQKPEIVATNPPPTKAVPVAALPAAPASKPLPATKAAARMEEKRTAPTLAVTKPNVAEATTAMTRTPPKPAVTNLAATSPSPARPAMPTVSTNVTPEDQRVARQWLASTNDRPAIRVHYRAGDVVRLSTDLGRALLVAGSGTTNRKEFYLEPASKAPLFSPFSKAVAKRFADYNLALNPSPAFEPLTTTLPAYFPDGDYDLAFVPDHTLATEIFAKVASAARSIQIPPGGTNTLVFEGRLALVESKPVFDIVTVWSGGQRLALTGESPAPASLPHAAATPNDQASP